MDYLNRVVPQLMPIIKELDRRVREKYTDKSVYIIVIIISFTWHTLIFIMVERQRSSKASYRDIREYRA